MRRGSAACGVSLVLALGCAGGNVDPRDMVDAGRDGGTRTDVQAADRVAPQDDTAAVEDTGVVETDVGPPPDAGPTCRGNNDGVLARSELLFLPGATALYATNDDGTVVEGVDTAGAAQPDGSRRWDFSAASPGDRRILDEALRPQGRWWSSRYPDATFATVIDRSTNLLGVYRVTDAALELLATVSTEDLRTDLRMDPPVVVLRFPLRAGDTWEQSVYGRGTVNFTPLINLTRYRTTVDSRGEVRTPASRFQALRVRTDLDQSIPATLFRRTRRTYTFVAECWGAVARVASTDNEAAEEFRRAAEYRRLSL